MVLRIYRGVQLVAIIRISIFASYSPFLEQMKRRAKWSKWCIRYMVSSTPSSHMLHSTIYEISLSVVRLFSPTHQDTLFASTPARDSFSDDRGLTIIFSSKWYEQHPPLTPLCLEIGNPSMRWEGESELCCAFLTFASFLVDLLQWGHSLMVSGGIYEGWLEKIHGGGWKTVGVSVLAW